MTKIGLLPFYVKLYDKTSPQTRVNMDKFKNEIVELLTKQDVLVSCADICCVKDEFQTAVDNFEKEKVDCIVPLFLAYSPSLESCDVLSKTSLPIIIMDTTPNYLFDYTIKSSSIMENHGIHGVQDFTCMLRRKGKDFSVFAGHYENSDVVKKVADVAKAINASNSLKKGLKVAMIGDTFEGMGDFLTDEASLKNLGIEKIICDGDSLEKSVNKVTEDEIINEFNQDKKICEMEDINFEDYKKCEKVGLGIRKWIKENSIDGFSMVFLSAEKLKGFDTMPFSEASKSMAKGIGYAGEGDVLTAGLCSAFMKSFKETGFVEMFCPDWQNGTIYMSHMGEFNLDLMENCHMVYKNRFAYSNNVKPTCIYGHAKKGKACLINIAPRDNGKFEMIFADGEMIELLEHLGEFDNSMSGWFKPNEELGKFLSDFSNCAGTHHSIIVYNASSECLKEFAKSLNIKYNII